MGVTCKDDRERLGINRAFPESRTTFESKHVVNMYSKVAFLCLAAVALARPDRRPAPSSGYGYNAPSQSLSYAPPTTPPPTYEAPRPSYSAPAPSYSAPAPSYEKHEEGMPFDFSYEVQDHYKGLDFGHESNSDGNVVTGEYRVALPDGRTQIVTYTADWKNGYNAEVTYEGEAQYPEETKSYEPAPSYSAPTPQYSAPEPPRNLYGAPRN